MQPFAQLVDVEPHEIWDGVLGRVVAGTSSTLAVIELDADAVVPEHRHENEQLGVLVAGSMTFRIGGEARELGPGSMWRIPPDTPHVVRVGPDGAVVVESFAPAREDWQSLARRPAAPPRWP
jgi:quercetin dioxygenase-like cupin family protein